MADAVKPISVKKVYTIFAIQMISVVAMVLCFDYFLHGVHSGGFTLARIDLICSYIILVITTVCLSFSKEARTTIPINYVLCSFLTFVMNYLVSVVACRYPIFVILVGIGVTFVCCIIASVVGYWVLINLLPRAGSMCLLVIILVLAETICSFLEDETVDTILGSINIICYIIFLAYATELVFTRDLNFAYPDYEFIFAALFLYTVSTYILYRSIVLCSILLADENVADY